MKKAIIITALVVLAMTGCSKPNHYMMGGPYRYLDDVSGAYGSTSLSVITDPILDTATVTINDRTMTMEFSAGMPSQLYFTDTTTPATNTEYKMKFKSEEGDASASCMVPGDFTLSEPSETLSVGASVILAWSESENADWYMINLYYAWFDTLTFDSKDSTYIIDGLSDTLPASWSDKTGNLYIEVVAGSGPRLETGSSGNISGAKGFWLGGNERERDVEIGTPAPMAIRCKRMNPSDFMVKYLKTLAPVNEAAREMLEVMGQ